MNSLEVVANVIGFKTLIEAGERIEYVILKSKFLKYALPKSRLPKTYLGKKHALYFQSNKNLHTVKTKNFGSVKIIIED